MLSSTQTLGGVKLGQSIRKGEQSALRTRVQNLASYGYILMLTTP